MFSRKASAKVLLFFYIAKYFNEKHADNWKNDTYF